MKMDNFIIEARFRNLIQARLLELGWMTYNPSADVGGVDWIMINLETSELKKIQQKGRITIDKKYLNKEIWIATIIQNQVFIFPHDYILETESGKKAKLTTSWEKGHYNWPKPPKSLLNDLQQYSYGVISSIQC